MVLKGEQTFSAKAHFHNQFIHCSMNVHLGCIKITHFIASFSAGSSLDVLHCWDFAAAQARFSPVLYCFIL